MLRVVYYARVSTLDEEQKNALKDQVIELENFINENTEWKLVDKYVDKGKSGTSTKGRTQYNRLCADISEDKFDIIVVKDESRLNRNMLNWYLFISEINQNEKKLYFYLERKFYSNDDDMITGIKALMAKEYSKDLSKKINNAHKQRQIKGKVCTNSTILGYDLVNKELVINEEQSKIVRFIYEEYVEGNGFTKIANMLFNKGIKNLRGNKYNQVSLRRILSNEKYKGDLVSNKHHLNFETKKRYNVNKENWIICESAIPPIVSKELWQEANDILESKTIKTDKNKFVGLNRGHYRYSSKIVCGTCGKNFWYDIRNNCKTNIWVCSQQRKYNNCINKSKYTMDDIDLIMKTVLKDFWDNKNDNIRNLISVLDGLIFDNKSSNTQKLISERQLYSKKKIIILDYLADEIITKSDFILQQQEYDQAINKISLEIYEIEESNKNLLSKKMRLTKIEKTLNENENVSGINEEIFNEFLDKIEVLEFNQVIVHLFEDIKYKVLLAGDNGRGNKGRTNKTIEKIELIC